jgi:two-component sensor histidine kinase
MADAATGRIMVTYRVEGHGWRLTVSDNGVGKPEGDQAPPATGLGTGIVAALSGNSTGASRLRRA